MCIRDRYIYTAPVGSFRLNVFELYDTYGNAWEWTQDCWNDSYDAAPSDGSAWESGECDRRVLRGGSWLSDSWFLRSTERSWRYRFTGDLDVGFRLAKTLCNIGQHI